MKCTTNLHYIKYLLYKILSNALIAKGFCCYSITDTLLPDTDNLSDNKITHMIMSSNIQCFFSKIEAKRQQYEHVVVFVPNNNIFSSYTVNSYECVKNICRYQ